MPAEYLACKRSLMKEGKSLGEAQRICAIAYYKKHHKSVQAAEEDGAEDAPPLSEVLQALEVREEFLPSQFTDIVILEEAGSPPASGATLKPGELLKFKGTALIDGAVSQRGYGRLYDREFNDQCIEKTTRRINEGHVVTIFGRHAKAVRKDGELGDGLPAGRVDRVYREEASPHKAKYEGTIVNTADGRDLDVLVRTRTMPGTSVRFYNATHKAYRYEGREIARMVSGALDGIDFTDSMGIEGAGVEAILEEGQVMEWDKVTLEELIAARKDLLDGYVASYLEANPPTAAKTVADPVVTAERDQLKTQNEELATAAVELQRDNKLMQASMLGVGRTLFGQLKTATAQVALEQLDAKITEQLPALRGAALNSFITSTKVPEVKPKGDVHPKEEEQKVEEEERGVPDAQVSEEHRAVLSRLI